MTRTPRSRPDIRSQIVMTTEAGAAEIGSCEVDLAWRNELKNNLPKEKDHLEDLKKSASLAQLKFYELLIICRKFKRLKIRLDEDDDLPKGFYLLADSASSLTDEFNKEYMIKIESYIRDNINAYLIKFQNILRIIDRLVCKNPVSSRAKLISKIYKIFESTDFIGIENYFINIIYKTNVIFSYTIEKLDNYRFPNWATGDLDRRMYQLFIEGKDSHTNYGKVAKTEHGRITKSIRRKTERFINQMSNNNFELQMIKSTSDFLGIVYIKVNGENCYIDQLKTDNLRREILERIRARRQRQPPESPPPTDPTA